MLDWTGITIGAIAFCLGGVLKGATGVGVPIIAVPILSWVYGVPVAVTLFSLPNLISNAFQIWRFRAHPAPGTLRWPFVAAGFAGAGAGTVILISVPADALLAVLAVVVLGYIGFRLARPDWRLPMQAANRLAAPIGLIGGLLFGAVGLSAPVSVTFLNSIRMEREVFISTISTFFFAMAVIQVPMLWFSGIMTPELALASVSALIPLWIGMGFGTILARWLSPRVFDRIILALLALIALRLLYRAIF